jgi:ElaB/YqjD/DUF883 family membrane-anchored ribosome-binding protein
MQARDFLKGNSSGEQQAIHAAEVLSKEFKGFVSDIEGMIRKTRSMSGEELDRAREEIKHRVDKARELIEENSETVARRAKKSLAYTNEYVRQNPWGSVGVTLAVGIICGFLLIGRK